MLQDKQARKDIEILKSKVADLQTQVRALRQDNEFPTLLHQRPITLKDVIRELLSILGYEVMYKQPEPQLLHKKEKPGAKE